MNIKPMNLRPGDYVDLERDPHADAEDRTNIWAYEYGLVSTIELETPECVVVNFSEVSVIGFPIDHELVVTKRGTEPYAIVVDQIDFSKHLKAGTVLPHVYVCGNADDASEWIAGKPGALEGRYGIDYPCGNSEAKT